MLLSTPDRIDRILWEGELEPEPAPEEENIKFATSPQRVSDLPIVSIGQPEVWTLAELHPDGVPPWLREKLNEANFFLVRLACSFRTPRPEFSIREANFSIELLSDNPGNRAIVFDLHPLEVSQESKRNFKVVLSPNLKFKEIQGSLGGAEFALEYPELQPMIIATGVGETRPNWQYRETRGQGIQGSKFMYAILKIPMNMQRVRAKLKVTADLRDNHGVLTRLFLRNGRRSESSDCLLVDLIG